MILDKFVLTDKVAIVTGSGKGIGKAIALGMAEAGADLVVCARTASDIEEVAAEIRKLGRKALAVPTDARNSEQVANLVQKTIDEFGRIDILVNNAGGTFRVKFLNFSENAWDAIIRENLKTVFLAKPLLSQMAQTDVTISKTSLILPSAPDNQSCLLLLFQSPHLMNQCFGSYIRMGILNSDIIDYHLYLSGRKLLYIFLQNHQRLDCCQARKFYLHLGHH